MSSKPKLIFTLVHGTFAKGADWVLDDEDPKLFRSRLKSALSEFDVAFDDDFEWGHDSPLRFLDNTLSARREGAEKLEGYLTGLGDREDKKIHRYIVAHSHGGNIALYALRNPEARKAIDGVICLATPFLKSKDQPILRDLFGFSALILFVLAYNLPPSLHWIWAMLIWGYTSVYLLVALIIIVSGSLGTSKASSDKESSHLDRLEFPTRDDLSGTEGKPSAWIFCVDKDEVGKIMEFAYYVGSAIRKSWNGVNTFGRWCVYLYFATIYPARYLVEKFEWESEFLESATAVWDGWVMTPLIVLASFMLMAMVVLRLSFAFDSVRWIARVVTWSNTVPWDGHEAREVPSDENAKGLLRHTMIQSQSTDMIADKIKKSFLS